MIDISALPVFLVAVVALLIVPGPDFLLIASQSIARGARFGVACSLGIFVAGIVQTFLVAIGLGKVMEAWPLAATVIRLLGAVYLAYLGSILLLRWYQRGAIVADSVPAATQSAASLLMVGMLNNLLNPKALLFFSVFIPQFVDQSISSPMRQIAIWGGLLSVLALAYNILLSLLCSAIRSLQIDVPRLQKHSQGVLGVLFLLLAARLAWVKAA